MSPSTQINLWCSVPDALIKVKVKWQQMDASGKECEWELCRLCRQRSQFGTRDHNYNVFTYADDNLHAVSMGNKYGSKVTKLTSVWHKRPQLRGVQAMTMKVYKWNRTLVEVGYLMDAKLGYVLKSCMQAVHVKTSAMGMWPDCRFHNSPIICLPAPWTGPMCLIGFFTPFFFFFVSTLSWRVYVNMCDYNRSSLKIIDKRWEDLPVLLITL